MSQVPIIIGVAGGSASGKTTVSQAILQQVGAERIAYIPHDCYYRDLSHLPFEQRTQLNVDHPDALDNELLVKHLDALVAGQAVEVPTYDFATYTRLPTPLHVAPRPVILLEGILIFAEPVLRRRMQIKLFVDADADLRFIRRLRRDIGERGRSVDTVIEQYLKTVRIMHLEFVEPTKRYADLIIPEGGSNAIAIDLVVARIEAALNH
ncbi:uridine kinase [Candidatus Viridilinea mediisalina]|uniref:Uridine kinase n=1 Tax=Candidatus Viridilinea mediisalina TaxID=2024553 RepID=A0A2A6RE76_9CHLR|nr:uridine kinase [Candidatus Viridilinea mediisalina]PDW01196.1 uridine kinase [Candidatus Viridilinea mediisalina]